MTRYLKYEFFFVLVCVFVCVCAFFESVTASGNVDAIRIFAIILNVLEKCRMQNGMKSRRKNLENEHCQGYITAIWNDVTAVV